MLCQRAIAGPGLTAHALPAKLCCALVGTVLWLLLLISAAAVCWNQMLYSGVVSPAWQGAGGDNGTSPNPNAINLEFELDLSDGVGSTLELSWLLVIVIAGPALLLCWAVAFVALKASADRLRRRGPQEPRSPLGSHLRPHLGRTSAALWQARAGGVAARGGGREPPRPRAARHADAIIASTSTGGVEGGRFTRPRLWHTQARSSTPPSRTHGWGLAAAAAACSPRPSTGCCRW